MNNLRKVNNDILKNQLDFREETFLYQLSNKNYKYSLNVDKLCVKIQHNISNNNKQFVQSQFDKLYNNFMMYLDY